MFKYELLRIKPFSDKVFNTVRNGYMTTRTQTIQIIKKMFKGSKLKK